MAEPFQTHSYWRYQKVDNSFIESLKPVVCEHAAELIVNGTSWLTLICSPNELEALAVGFLWNENVIAGLQDIMEIKLTERGEKIWVQLNVDAIKPSSFHRTSTGLAINQNFVTDSYHSTQNLSAEELINLYREFNEKQTLHEAVGGFHSAALSDGKSIQIIVEDVGRHNCVDKLAGIYLSKGSPFQIKAALLSGRISSEMVYKSMAMRIPIIASRTSPTSLAIDIAEKAGITLVGYLRGGQFEVYTHPERIVV